MVIIVMTDEMEVLYMRIDERLKDELRQVKITTNYTKHAEGSVLIEVGRLKLFVLLRLKIKYLVLCVERKRLDNC